MLTPSSVNSIKSSIARKDVVYTTEELLKKIQDCATEQFTGQLDFQSTETQSQRCSLYFSLGNVFGCSSTVHPMRRWYRQLSLFYPQSLPFDSQVLATYPASVVTQRSDPPQCWDYDSLAALVRLGKVSLGQMAAIVEGYATELLFDIIQSGEKFAYRCGLQLSYKPIPQDAIDLRWVMIRAEQAWKQAIQAWHPWQGAGLTDISPNLAPTILQAEKLRQETSPPAYRNLITLADGNQTLRDLAVKLKQNLLLLSQSLLPYIRNGLIGLIEVGDLSQPIKSAETIHTPQQKSQNIVSPYPLPADIRATNLRPPPSRSFLVAYIDDSRIDSQTMNQILQEAGYRCLIIEDSVQALVQLLEHKPNLIFLDLVMPVANGYEICAQIRRVSVFKETPVIILTGNDGIVDRVRAKMVGSSGFLAKPITQQKVLGILQRYLPTVKPS